MFHPLAPWWVNWYQIGCPSKQPKLEPKLFSALSETKHLFRLFRFYIETESFDVSIEPKQTEDQPKQLDRENILLGFYRKFWVFPVFLFFCFFRFVLVVLLLYRSREFRCFDWTETNRRPTQTVWERVYLVNFQKI